MYRGVESFSALDHLCEKDLQQAAAIHIYQEFAQNPDENKYGGENADNVADKSPIYD